MNVDHCIFCKIAAGLEPASRVYESDELLAFMDAYPLTSGHCLVIPKRHYVRLEELPDSTRAKLFNLGHQIIEAQKRVGMGVQGTNLLVNDGKAANQTIPHLHLHLIPRESGDIIKAIPKLFLHLTGVFGIKTSRRTLDQQAALIKEQLKHLDEKVELS